MKWIVGTCFDSNKGMFEVIERSWNGNCVIVDRVGKTHQVHESKLEQSFREGKLYNHRVVDCGLDIHLEDGIVKKIKKHKK